MAAILSATDIELRHNEQVILDKATLSIDERDRIGMVGRNGSGKSTFLRILAGLQVPDGGVVNRRRDLIIGHLPQQFELNPDLTVEENIRAGAQHVSDLIAEFESLPSESSRHEGLEKQILACDGWHLDQRIATVMDRLNCAPGHLRMDTLSGGERRRIALARALVAQPDLLLLDEPTNHLDMDSVAWLGQFLKQYAGAFLLVTHDRYFLDEITGNIAELANGKIYSYQGNYTDYLLAKAERDTAMEVAEHKRQMFLRRELEWVRRGPKARTTKSKSRLDRYFEIANQGPVTIDKDVDLVIPTPPPLGNRVAELVNVGMELGGKRLFSEINLDFEPGQRIGITGRNGLGKTTLLKVIQGELAPTEGTVKIGPLTVFNYVDQGRVQLDDERTVLEEISDGTEFVVYGEQRVSLRGYLKRFLFADDRITTKVKHLSGGERSRLLLARILKDGGNFLILDEPTNDLDLPTLRVLEEALLRFPGVVLVVSHDRYFLNRVCTAILAFEGAGHVTYSVGDYDYYIEKSERNATPAAECINNQESLETPELKRKQESSRPRKLSYKEKLELEGIEEKILASEEDVARLESMFADPDFHRKYGRQTEELKEALAAAKAKAASLYQRWEELEMIRMGDTSKETE